MDANRAPEDAELEDVIDEMGRPDAFTLERLKAAASGCEIQEWLRERRNRRAIPHRLEACGYFPVRQDKAKDGYWVINGVRQAIYGKTTCRYLRDSRQQQDSVNRRDFLE